MKSALENLLASRGFGPTLAAWQAAPEAPSEMASQLRPGTVSELVPDREAEAAGGGVTSRALQLAAAAPGPVAWLDPQDSFDPASAARAGVALERLLWVRGGQAPAALEAAQLILHAGRFALVVVDFLDLPSAALRIPRAAWFRLLRTLERERRASLLVLAPRPLAGSCADQVIACSYQSVEWRGSSYALFDRARLGFRLVTSRRAPSSVAQAPGKRPVDAVGPVDREFVA
ncbi:MAG TPA: hypothetical protein VN709_02360 [Terriglobales bacterium]|nr:hypothetical protein [Terriglobales bacterium]